MLLQAVKFAGAGSFPVLALHAEHCAAAIHVIKALRFCCNARQNAK
jgi:hypothetical protein